MDVGAGVYGQWQVTDDKGSDAFRGDAHDQVYGIGPQIGITYVPWGAASTAKWMHELGSENRLKGDYFTLNFAVSL